MTSAQRFKTILSGGKPDRVPTLAIYDWAYIMQSNGNDLRSFITANSKQRIHYIEQGFLKHNVDAFLVHIGQNNDFADNHTIKVNSDAWIITNNNTGEIYNLLPDGSRKSSNGSITIIGDYSENMAIKTMSDVDNIDIRIIEKAEYESSMIHDPLKHLTTKYPDKHFIFQISSPFVRAIDSCGGFEEGLVMMATEKEIFSAVMDRFIEKEKALVRYGSNAGGKSILLTSYYTGADTISPKDYAEVVFPAEKQICEEAKKHGLCVLYWFLGDLIPVLDKVKELPIDALILEQGRKGYDIDPVEIRKRIGNKLCISGFGYELDYCKYNKKALKAEFLRQFEGTGKNGAFAAGTPIMPPNANPDAVDYYFNIAKEYGIY